MLQSLIVVMLVTGCTAYAAWTLMPSAARRALAVALLKLSIPAALTSTLQRAAKAPSGCGCDGCDRAPKKAAPSATHTVTFHPRPKR